MRVRVLFFAGLRDLAGKREWEYDIREKSILGDLHRQVFDDFPALNEMKGAVRVAVNEEYSNMDRPLSDGDTVALIPPVSGG